MSTGDSVYDDDPPAGALARLKELVRAHSELRRRISFARKFNAKYDVPYLAGSSLDGKTIYFDPALIEGTRGEEWARTLVTLHEIVEWALKPWERGYEPRHHMATSAEYEFAPHLGHTEGEYKRLLRPLYKPIENENIESVPPDLDLSPYSGKLKGYLYDLQHGKLAKSKVNYGPGVKSRNCGLCEMFRDPHDCTLVAGNVRAQDVCNRFMRRVG